METVGGNDIPWGLEAYQEDSKTRSWKWKLDLIVAAFYVVVYLYIFL